MVDSIEFRSGDYETVTGLAGDIMSEDERAIEVPSSARKAIHGFFRKMMNSVEDGEQFVLSLGKEEGDTVYIVNLSTADYEDYGTFVYFDDHMKGIYFTTGGSAIDLVIELQFKLSGMRMEGKSRIYSRATGASDYIEADMEFPDTGFKSTRTQVDLDRSNGRSDEEDMN